MWLTTLHPKAMENEIIQTNRYKVIIFNVFEQVETQKMEWQNTTKPCQNNEDKATQMLSTQKLKWQNFQDQINSYKSKIHQTEEEIQNLSFFQSYSFLKKTTTTNQDYLQNISDWHLKMENQVNLVFDWQIQINKFCISGLEDQNKLLPEFEKSFEKLQDLELGDEWKKNSEEVLQSTRKLVKNKWSEDSENAENKQEITQWKEKVNKVFELKISQPEFDSAFKESVRDLERWEIRQVENNPKLASGLIFFGKRLDHKI
jgi:hypothetical protein